jgi:hypothetical protein
MMMRRLIGSLPLVALVAALTATAAPAADAQGRGNRDRDRDRVEHRDRDRDRDDRWDDRRHRSKNDDRRVARNGRRVPPGWCTGRGNPHNTRENCGWSARRSDGRVSDRGGVYRRIDGRMVRVGDRRGTTSGRYSSRASWDRAHRDYHDAYERTCRERVRRTSGLRQKVEVQRQCSAQHDRWHQLNRRPS